MATPTYKVADSRPRIAVGSAASVRGSAWQTRPAYAGAGQSGAAVRPGTSAARRRRTSSASTPIGARTRRRIGSAVPRADHARGSSRADRAAAVAHAVAEGTATQPTGLATVARATPAPDLFSFFTWRLSCPYTFTAGSTVTSRCAIARMRRAARSSSTRRRALAAHHRRRRHRDRRAVRSADRANGTPGIAAPLARDARRSRARGADRAATRRMPRIARSGRASSRSRLPRRRGGRRRRHPRCGTR